MCKYVKQQTQLLPAFTKVKVNRVKQTKIS